MEDEEIQQSAMSQVAEPVNPSTPPAAGVAPQAVIFIVLTAVGISLMLSRLARSSFAGDLRRWLPVLYALLWGATLLSLTAIYARGLDNTAFVAVFIVFVVVALSSVGWLRSVMSGVAISLEGRIRIGDTIRIDQTSGEVVGFGVRSLRLRAVDGSIHEIPNEKIVTESVTNLSGTGGDTATELMIPVPPEINPETAVQIARSVAILTPLASPRHQPEVFLEAGGPHGRQFEIRVRGFAFDAAYQDHFRSDVVARIQHEFTNHIGAQRDREPPA